MQKGNIRVQTENIFPIIKKFLYSEHDIFIRELVSNAVKHSGANLLEITLEWQIDLLLIRVQDNGTGFKLKESRAGVGWWNIEQRAKRLKAEIDIGNPPMESGSLISITIPLKNGKE